MSLPWTNRRQLLQGAATLGVAAALGPHVAFSADHKILRNRGEYRIQTLDPAFMWTNEEHMILVATMPRLIQFKAGDEWGWELADAKRIELVDQTHVEFELNEGMEWSDGYGEVTAEDVKFTFERVVDPAVESWYADDWANLDHVEVTGKLSGVIVLSKPFAPLFTSTLPYWQGTILCKKAVMELPDQKIELTLPAQCGPYKLVELVSETKALMVPNDDWYGSPKAAFDEIQLMVITEAKTAEIGYLAGELDIARISSSSVPTFQADMPPNTELVVGDALSYFWLGMMVEHPLYKDRRVRKAVQYAIDVQEVLDGGFQGVAKPSTGMIAPGLIGYREKRLVQGPDRDKSRQLLAEAGYPDGFDTKLVTGKAAEWVTAATVIQSQLAEVGIRGRGHAPGNRRDLGYLAIRGRLDGQPDAPLGLWDSARSQLGDRLVPAQPGGLVELGTLGQQGVRGAALRRPRGVGPGQAPCHVSAHDRYHGGRRRVCLPHAPAQRVDPQHRLVCRFQAGQAGFQLSRYEAKGLMRTNPFG